MLLFRKIQLHPQRRQRDQVLRAITKVFRQSHKIVLIGLPCRRRYCPLISSLGPRLRKHGCAAAPRCGIPQAVCKNCADQHQQHHGAHSGQCR